MEEEMLVFTISELKKEFGKKVMELYGIEIVVPELSFPKIKFKECVEILEQKFGIIIPE